MVWYELYSKENQPKWEDIENYVNNHLWDELCTFIENTYNISPKIEYSCCSAQKGWNIKYKKSNKSLCTLYPMEGYFIALVVIGEKEQAEAELILPTCSKYTFNLYQNVPFALGGRWLMLEVKDSDVLVDVKRLIQLRRKPKTK